MFSKRKEMDMSFIRTSSKDALKRSLMQAYQSDIDTMQKMYDFYMKDMTALPDFDPVQPTAFQQAKDTIASLWSWADQNQDKILGAYNLFRTIKGGAPIPMPGNTPIPADVPPLPNL